MSVPKIQPNSQSIHLPNAAANLARPEIKVGFESTAEKKAVLDWLTAGLRPGRPGRLQQEYPLLLKRDTSAFHLTLFRDSRPIAFCCVWAVQFRVGAHPLRAGLISLVYTDPQFRNQGYASQIIDAALDKIESLNLGLAILWSDVAGFYRHKGFVQSGRASLLVIDDEIVESAHRANGTDQAHATPITIRSPNTSDWESIELIRSERDCQLELNPGDLSSMRSIPDMTVRVAHDNNRISAFAIRGRGDDFEEVIHEWGGDPQAALLCIHSLLHDCEPHNELFLLSPPQKNPTSWMLRKAGSHVIQTPLAWMRIASTIALSEDLSRIVPSFNQFRICIDRNTDNPEIFEIRTVRGHLEVNQAKCLELFFGPQTQFEHDHLHQDRKQLLPDAIVQDLPIPFFIWGMESI